LFIFSIIVGEASPLFLNLFCILYELGICGSRSVFVLEESSMYKGGGRRDGIRAGDLPTVDPS